MPGMSTDHHGTDAPDHAAIAVGDDGHADDGHAESALGPIDTPAWLAGALGVLLGLAVVAGFVLATSGLPA